MDYCSQSFSLAQEIGNVERIKVAAAALKKIYKSQNQGMKALEMFELEVQMSDSLKSEEITKQIAQAESRAEFEKHQLIKEQDAKETARIEAEKIADIRFEGKGCANGWGIAHEVNVHLIHGAGKRGLIAQRLMAHPPARCRAWPLFSAKQHTA